MTILALDIGGTKIRAGLVSGPAVSDVRDVPTAPRAGEDSIMGAIGDLVRRYSGYEAIAVASAGVVSGGKIIAATDLIPHWAGTDIATILGDEYHVPVCVLGDVHAHGVGEAAYGAAAAYSSSLTVGVGTGIGGAFVDAGLPATGEHGAAGHIGHITHGDARELLCSCGRYGHVEPLSSGTGMTAAYERLTGESIGGRELDRRAEDGDETAVDVLSRGGRALGEVLGSLANAFDPAVIVVSGSVSRSTSFWWPGLREGFDGSAMDLVKQTPLIIGELGDDAPLIGAAAFANKKMS